MTTRPSSGFRTLSTTREPPKWSSGFSATTRVLVASGSARTPLRCPSSPNAPAGSPARGKPGRTRSRSEHGALDPKITAGAPYGAPAVCYSNTFFKKFINTLSFGIYFFVFKMNLMIFITINLFIKLHHFERSATPDWTEQARKFSFKVM